MASGQEPVKVDAPRPEVVLRDCNRSSAVEAVKAAIGTEDERYVWIAAALLASVEPPMAPADLIEVCTSFLAAARSKIAGDILWRFALNAPVARVRVEAVKRSGRSASTPERRQFLRQWALNGFEIGHQLNYAPVQPPQMSAPSRHRYAVPTPSLRRAAAMPMQ